MATKSHVNALILCYCISSQVQSYQVTTTWFQVKMFSDYECKILYLCFLRNSKQIPETAMTSNSNVTPTILLEAEIFKTVFINRRDVSNNLLTSQHNHTPPALR